MLLAAALAISLQRAVFINFDHMPGGNYVKGNLVPIESRLSKQLQSLYGIAFTSGAGYVAIVDQQGRANTPPNGITGTTPQGLTTYARANPIEMTFWDPNNTQIRAGTNFVCVQGDTDSARSWPITLNAYDVAGNLVDTDTQVDDRGTVLAVSSETFNICRVEFLGAPGDEDGIAIDNIRFQPVKPLHP